MRFSEGFIRARGQIVFVLALIVSTAIIVRLEYLGTEERTRAEVERQLEAAMAPESVELTALALANAEASFAAEDSRENRGALLVAISLASRHGLVGQEDGEHRARQLMTDAPTEPLSAAFDAGVAAAAASFPALAEEARQLMGSR
jgi:hypothetical protein